MQGYRTFKMNKRILANPNLWQFIKYVQSKQTAKEIEMNQMNNGVILVALTRRQKDKSID